MHNNLLLFLFVLVFLFNGITQDTLTEKRIKILPVPAFGYSPETKTYIGAVAIFTFDLYQDTLTRSSNAKLEFNYTWLKQVIAESEWNYFFKQEKWFSQGLVHYSYFPDYYFGIGNNRQENERTGFSSNRIKLDLTLLKRLKNDWFLGGGIRFYDYRNVLSQGTGITYSELKDRQSMGLNTLLVRDKRNNILTPSSGSYLRILSSHNYSEEYYSGLQFDARRYFTIGKDITHTFSARFLSQHVFGTAPFYDLALVGGDKIARGYYYGRFRDSNVSTLQLEYRTMLWWRLGIAMFGGCSAVYGEPESVKNSLLKPNGGMGLRFVVDKKEKTNLRFDYAVGAHGQRGFYVSFGESF